MCCHVGATKAVKLVNTSSAILYPPNSAPMAAPNSLIAATSLGSSLLVT